MSDNIKKIQNHYNRYNKERHLHKNVKDVVILNDNWMKWYVIIHNLEDELFVGGEFIMELSMPSDIVRGPPAMRYLTETGIFKVGPNSNICLSISSFHPSMYSPAIGIIGFVNMIIGTLPYYQDLKGGVSVLSNPTRENIKECTSNSIIYNMKHHFKILENSKFSDQYQELYVLFGIESLMKNVKTKSKEKEKDYEEDGIGY
jgi:ubiquitin-protein ligase